MHAQLGMVPSSCLHWMRCASQSLVQMSCCKNVKPACSSPAVRENAAEACATQCRGEVESLTVPSDEEETTQERHKYQEAYDLCYSKCVASETEQVAQEREQVGLCCYLSVFDGGAASLPGSLAWDTGLGNYA